MNGESYTLYGESLAARQVLGVGVCAGWELVTRRGSFVRGDVGPALTNFGFEDSEPASRRVECPRRALEAEPVR